MTERSSHPDFRQLAALGRPEKSPDGDLIKVKIISPDAPVAEILASKVLLPSVNGDIMILPNRAPIIMTLRPGRMVVYDENGKGTTFFVSRGISEVRRNLCPVLAWAGKELDAKVENIQKVLDKAETAMAKSKTAAERSDFQEHINFLKFTLNELKGKQDVTKAN